MLNPSNSPRRAAAATNASPVVEVVVDIPAHSVDKPFHYTVPDRLRGTLRVGHRVRVPFGPRRVDGYVTGWAERPGTKAFTLKPVEALLDPEPLLSQANIRLAHWMADRYVSRFVDALRLFLPPGVTGRGGGRKPRVRARIVTVYGAAPGALRAASLPAAGGAASSAERAPAPVKRGRSPDPFVRAPAQARLWEAVRLDPAARRTAAEWARLASVSPAVVRALAERGYLTEARLRVDRNPNESFRGAPQSRPPSLTRPQADALSAVCASIDRARGEVLVLHGVTGSGKTEVYMRSIAHALASSLQAIILVPEIALTPQTVERFVGRFGSQVAILHSRLSAGERFDQWEKVYRGDVRVVVGARSALFAPCRELGLVILDEEHETSYKQEEAPRYHAREVAAELVRQVGASLLLGSATPSLETFQRCRTGRYKLLTLPERVEARALPAVTTVDMRAELKSGNRSIFSRTLARAIGNRLAAGEQMILFLNRRGYAQFVLCRECGSVVECPHCQVSLTVHGAGKTLRCHYCDYRTRLPERCAACTSALLRPFGTGTERVERELRAAFPDLTTLRMDADTTRRKNAHRDILARFASGEAQALVGTQMVAKGHDFPRVTLVGVLAADAGLHLPDFRAAERTFQLLTQVAGRAGRGDLHGEVVIQTYAPDHYSIQAAKRQDYEAFFEQEIAYRARSGYPPFSSLSRAVVSGPDQVATARAAMEFGRMLGARKDGEAIIGPAPAPISKMKDRYRWHVLLRGDGTRNVEVLQQAAEAFHSGRVGRETTLTLDVDPVSML